MKKKDNFTHYEMNGARLATPEKKKKSRKTLIVTLVCLLINIIVIGFVAVSAYKEAADALPEGEAIDFFKITGNVFSTWGKNYKYILLAFGCFFVVILAETLKYYIIIREKTGIWNFRLALRTVIMGKYYDSITPLGSGGQGFQVYYLNKDGVPLGIASAMPFISFFLNQLAMVIMCIFMFIYLEKIPLGNMGVVFSGVKILGYIGAFLSIATPGAVIGASLFPKLTNGIVKFVDKILHKIKFIRNPDRIVTKINRTVTDYQQGMGQYKKSGFVLFIMFLLSFVYKLGLYSMPYFIIKGCGVTFDAPSLAQFQLTSEFKFYLLCTCFTLLCTAAVCFVPTPGTSGASEISFKSIFTSFLVGEFALWGMLLWRVTCYYLFIIVGFGLVIINTFRHKRKKAFITSPLTQSLHQYKSQGITFYDELGNKKFYEIPCNKISTFIGLLDYEDSKFEKPIKLVRNKEFSCLTENAYVIIDALTVNSILNDKDELKIYGIGFDFDLCEPIENKVFIDTGREITPFDHEEIQIYSTQFIDSFFPFRDGAVNTVDKYCRFLSVDGVKCKAVVPQYTLVKDLSRNYDVTRVKSYDLPAMGYRRSFPRLSLKLKRSLEPDGLTIFHAHSPFSLGKYALRMGRRYNLPIISSFHAKYYEDVLERTNSKFLAKLVLKKIVEFNSHCDEVWVPNERSLKTLRDYGFEKEIKVIPNGTNWVYPRNSDAIIKETSKKFGLKKNEFKLVYAEEISTRKNLDTLVKALKLLDFQKLNIHIIILGKFGKGGRRIETLIKNCEFKNTIVDIIECNDNDTLRDAVLCSDLNIMLSTYDNAPYIVQDAAALKVPSLLIEDSNAASNIIDNDNGFLVKNSPDEVAIKLQELVKSKDKIKTVGKKASDTLTISWEEVSKIITEDYMALLKKYYLPK